MTVNRAPVLTLWAAVVGKVLGGQRTAPEEIALAFHNGLARAAGCRVWQDGFYVGTFSEYDLEVIRRIGRQS